MKVFKLSVWFKLLAWFLLAAFGIKLLSLMNRTERIRSSPVRHAAKLIGAGAVYGAPPAPPPPPPPPPEHRPKATRTTKPINEPLELEQLLRANSARNWSLNDNCAPYPRFEDLHIENLYYQYTRGGNVSYYLMSAYYDRRLAMDTTPSVVLLGMISSLSGPFERAFCQLWYEQSAWPELVDMEPHVFGWFDSWGFGPDHVYPVLLTCPLVGTAREHRVPQLVSLVFGDRCARPCNALRVHYEAPQRRRATRFGVCVKDLQFPTVDMSERFVEWLELMRLLGAERVIAYDLGGQTLLPNTMRTLKHYAEQDGLLQLLPFRLLEGHPKPAANYWLSKRLNEVLMYNDCLYRNMYEFDYLAVMDVDEVIMPLGKLHNWTALVELLDTNNSRNSNSKSESAENCFAKCSLCFRNVYFSRELPEDGTPPASFYMLRHVQRVAEHLDANSAIKCLHATAYVTMVHNHFPLGWRGACGPHDVSAAIGQMQHYREPDIKQTLKEPPPVRDDNIWRFKEQLISKALVVHRQLGWSLP
ncbi:uncharacterized protein LOC115767404 [Drosophila novamexicana]|uniref:uncharacterized protein LOC115767404 n=1 Tax=Drosophila novamexicana TaxID=47314 RepID=UPI0011E59A53|nr:uncharacterized protein LOC115767404 [Drosophila novamexicana]